MRRFGLAAAIAVLSACASDNICPFARQCGATCCAAGAVCVKSSAGATSCGTLCDDSSQCASATPCCAPLGGGTCVSQADCLSVCAVAASDQYCRCSAASACATGCCAPGVDSSGNPVGPYVCSPNDGASYDCCNGTQKCSGTACCAADPNGSNLCITPCAGTGAGAGDGGCGAARCTSYASATNPSACPGGTPSGCSP